jgi:O-antigen/teichoic acid export membrane protein
MSNGDLAPRDRRQESRTGLLANFLMIAGSGYFELLTGLVRSILVMRFLGPTGQGLIGLVQLVERYLSNSHLGVLHGISKLLPSSIGTGNEEEAQELEDSGVSWTIVTGAISAAGIILAAFLYPGIEPLTRLVLAIGALVYFSDQVYNLYRTVARAWQVYQPLVLSSVVLSLALTLFMILGAWRGLAVGAMLGWLAATLLAVVAQYVGVRIIIRPRLHRATVKKLLLAGIPLAAMAFGDTLLTSVDSTILLRRGAVMAFGLYVGIAMQTRRYIFNLVRALSFVLLPHLLEEFARNRSLERLRAVALQPTVALSIGVPFLSALTAVFLPAAAHTFVPKFYSAVPAGQIVAFGTCIMTLPLALSASLIVLDREWEAVAGQCVGSLAIVLFAWESAGRADLVGVAVGSSLGAWCMTVTLGLVAMARLGMSLSHSLLALFTFHIPLAWALGAWLAADRFAPQLGAGPAYSWPGAFVRFAVMALLLAPLAVYTVRRFGIPRRFKAAVSHLRQARKGGPSGPEPE